MKYLDEIDIKGKTLFIRVDFNVPLDQNRNITDDTRIRAVLPTINYCLEGDAKVVLASHLGRPKGQRVEDFSLAPVARRLAYRLHKKVKLAPDCIGPEVEQAQGGDEARRCAPPGKPALSPRGGEKRPEVCQGINERHRRLRGRRLCRGAPGPCLGGGGDPFRPHLRGRVS